MDRGKKKEKTIMNEAIQRIHHKRLKRIRLEKKLTQGNLSWLSDIGAYRYGQIERGEIDPYVCELVRISDRLGVNPDRLAIYRKDQVPIGLAVSYRGNKGFRELYKFIRDVGIEYFDFENSQLKFLGRE